MKSVLLIDDDPEFTQVASHIIEFLGHIVSVAESVEEAKQWLQNNEFDHLLIDFMLPDGSGLHVYEALKNKARMPRVTFITGNPQIKSAINHIAGPGVNYLMKPIEREDLESVLTPKKHARTKAPIKTTSTPPKNALPNLHFGCLMGESALMKTLYKMIERVAPSHANVMLMGESGVGKELVAEAIHNASLSQGDLIATNCGGLSKELIGSELFGHEKGAFTGAIGQKKGVFERASGGSLFLDEVTEMPIDMQPNLLRVLETKRVNRVGGTQEILVNCRIISATNRTLDQIANEHILREDIYFRLAVFPIEIPPLRKRKDDISLLANAFLTQLNTEHNEHFVLSPAQIDILTSHDWPGNVRELRHSLHRAFIMSEPGSKTLELPSTFDSPFSQKSHKPSVMSAGNTIEEVEKSLIYATLDEVGGNKTTAAEMLGISTKTLYNRLHAYGEKI
ncbi:transcriptional regulatory protein zraR [Glaciecola punicea ACAM 611]|uniref:Transcriptional regulatory protein zraR n=1 Tax=Glaciecola punicea ACAM 611 TaxID=1121923 RepID=H5TE13_9ALTE|nr:sigma-54 dependent transcriptional regulator [Glaciecola punicea]OFA31084.1 sigma-54-dependent Fis family transcriptional regulator [Glaciecola punicea]GAB56540.1 transcriptional regulatory protein zraR [Glaciecola punicea ACAM 611]